MFVFAPPTGLVAEYDGGGPWDFGTFQPIGAAGAAAGAAGALAFGRFGCEL